MKVLPEHLLLKCTQCQAWPMAIVSDLPSGARMLVPSGHLCVLHRRWTYLAAEGLLDPLERKVLQVLHLDPVLRSSAAVGPIGALRDEAFEAHGAGAVEEIGTDPSCSKSEREIPSGRRVSRRARLVL